MSSARWTSDAACVSGTDVPPRPRVLSHCALTDVYSSANIRYRIVNGMAVILDLRAGDYVILNRVATAMWKTILAHRSSRESIADLARQFDASAPDLERDLTTFRETCVERGFLQAHPPPENKRALGERNPDAPTALKAWWSLALTSYRLSRFGFGPTYRRYALLPSPASSGQPSPERVAAAERAFLRAENFFPLRSAPRDCLPRSLALYHFALSAGLPAEHLIGVRRLPFEAHAWVECAGRPLLDAPREIAAYSTLARL